MTQHRVVAPRVLQVFSFVESASGTRYDDMTNYQRNLSHRRGRGRGGAAARSTTRPSTASGATTSPFYHVNAPVAGFDTDRETFLGLYNGWGEPQVVGRGAVVELGRQRLVADRVARPRRDAGAGRGDDLRVRARLRGEPARRRSGRSPGVINKKRALGCCIGSSRPDEQVDAALLKALARPLVEAAVELHRSTVGRREARPHGQHLEPVPVHGHVQHVAQRLVLRDRDRPRHGLPRLEPGSARVRAPGSRARARAHHRHRVDAVPRRQRVPPVPAAHQARQQRHRRRVQRRSAVADLRRRRLHPRDRRLRRSSTSRSPFDNDPEDGDLAVRAPEALVPPRAQATWGRTGCRSSAAPTGTTASTSTASRRRPTSRSRPPGTEPGARRSRCSSPACSCGVRARLRRTCAEKRGSATRPRRRAARGRPR